LIDKRNRCAEVRLKMESDMIVGYARVSTDSQTLDAQQSSLSVAGAEKVFAEKVSGAVTDRKALAKAIAALGAGDVLLVTRLDRLARPSFGPALPGFPKAVHQACPSNGWARLFAEFVNPLSRIARPTRRRSRLKEERS
jgi:hypothetical protein